MFLSSRSNCGAYILKMDDRISRLANKFGYRTARVTVKSPYSDKKKCAICEKHLHGKELKRNFVMIITTNVSELSGFVRYKACVTCELQYHLKVEKY